MKPRFEVWQAGDGRWYWHLRAGNTEIVAQGQGYTRCHDCWRAIRRIKAIARAAK